MPASGSNSASNEERSQSAEAAGTRCSISVHSPQTPNSREKVPGNLARAESKEHKVLARLIVSGRGAR